VGSENLKVRDNEVSILAALMVEILVVLGGGLLRKLSSKKIKNI
jgi:hypothetical protein